MKRAPKTFTLVLVLVALALALALSVTAALSARMGRRVTGDLYGHLAAAAAVAVDDVSARHDAQAQGTLTILQSLGVHLESGPPPNATVVRIAPALRDTGEMAGRLLGDPSRVRVTQIPDSQIWIRSVHDPRRWIVLRAASYRRQVIDSSLLVTAFAGLIALIFAGWVARLLTRPLERLSSHAGELLAGDSIAAHLHGAPREVQRLAEAIDGAGERLREAARERELMLAGISHDLRTPLARLRIALELGDADDPQRREAMVADLQQLDDALEQCLAFVRDGRGEALRELDLATLIGQLLALRAQPDHWRYDGPTSLHANLRPTLLRRALGNLLDNAERYGAAPYRIALTQDAQELRVCVEDRGPGVRAELLPKLGKPFVRGDAARGGGGSGLGLSIVQRAAELHGGALHLRNREGGGFIAELRLPISS
ncbi:MAG TPA: ATP-binding protein [Rhodanobacteraceae bacterium]|nr:ATP-binding protein [Rhodanobacteraceae bacterium]